MDFKLQKLEATIIIQERNMSLDSLKVGRLSTDVYHSGLEHFPIPTVDFVLVKGTKFLLIKRNEGAFNGDWFVAGGRQNRGETQLNALLRIAKRELGLTETDVKRIKFSHPQDVFNPTSTNSDGELPAWHSIWHFHVIEVNPAFVPVLDSTSNGFRWVENLDGISVPAPVRKALKEANLVD